MLQPRGPVPLAVWLLVCSLLVRAQGEEVPLPGPVVCATQREAHALLHLAMTESFPAIFIFDVASAAAAVASDDGDVEFEQARVGAFAEWAGVLRQRDRTLSLPANAAALHVWSNASVRDSEAVTLWYLQPGDEEAAAGDGHDDCQRLMAPSAIAERTWRLLPVVHALLMERLLYIQAPVCPDINQRLMMDPVSYRSQCVCQQDKACGPAGSRNMILLYIIIVLACVLIFVTDGVVLYTVVAKLRERVNDVVGTPSAGSVSETLLSGGGAYRKRTTGSV
jgi:hypothetical protein